MKRASLLILLLFFSGVAWGDNELANKSRLASAQDLFGEWEMSCQKNGNLIPNSDPYIMPYQRFYFFPDGYVKNIALNEPFDQQALSIWRMAPKSSQYRLKAAGEVFIKGSSGDITSIRVVVITQDLEESMIPGASTLKKGDLFLSYFTPDNKIYLERCLGKIK